MGGPGDDCHGRLGRAASHGGRPASSLGQRACDCPIAPRASPYPHGASWPSTIPRPPATRALRPIRPAVPGLGPMSGTWDRDEAAAFVETLFARHHGEIYVYLLRMMRDPEVAADMTQDAFIKAYRNYDTAREAGERPGLALPDRPSRRARRDPATQDHPVRSVDRRIAWSRPIGRAPGHGRQPVRRPAAGPGPDPRAPAGGSPARRAPRPDRRGAGRGPGRQSRRRSCPADPGARKPASGAGRGTRHRGRGGDGPRLHGTAGVDR